MANLDPGKLNIIGTVTKGNVKLMMSRGAWRSLDNWRWLPISFRRRVCLHFSRGSLSAERLSPFLLSLSLFPYSYAVTGLRVTPQEKRLREHKYKQRI